MAATVARPKGTADIYGTDAALWQYIEEKIRKITAAFGVEEIRTPIFENVDLFVKSVGETTDIVQKEMYTFEDQGGRTYVLKPEGTAAAVRAYIENSLHNMPFPCKFYYISPIFRAERPQKGRYRQHHQFGVEYFGSYSPTADAELLSLAYLFLTGLGVENLTLRINSVGDKECRARYNKALLNFLDGSKDKLCGLCKERMTKNPMRVLDCKNPDCGSVITDAPVPLDYLSDDCMQHFNQLQDSLVSLDIPFVVDKGIVRGLDYYTHTVFEFTSTDLGAQATVCGGGRYNNLIESHGGAPTGAVGFGMGIERLLIILEQLRKLPEVQRGIDIYIGSMGAEGAKKAGQIAYEMRKLGISAVSDLAERSVKAQMKYADKLNAKYSVVIGCTELETGVVTIKNMTDGKTAEINIDKILEFVQEA